MRLRCGCGAVGRGGAGLPAVHGAVCLAAHDTSCAGGCCRRGTVPFATRKKIRQPLLTVVGFLHPCRTPSPGLLAYVREAGSADFPPSYCHSARLCAVGEGVVDYCSAAPSGSVLPRAGWPVVVLPRCPVSCRRSVAARLPGGRLPAYGLLEDVAVGGILGREGAAAVLDAEHHQRLAAVVADRAASLRRHAYHASFAYGEALAVDLELAPSAQEEVELLVGAVRVQEAGLGAGSKALEGELGARGPYGSTSENLARQLAILPASTAVKCSPAAIFSICFIVVFFCVVLFVRDAGPRCGAAPPRRCRTASRRLRMASRYCPMSPVVLSRGRFGSRWLSALLRLFPALPGALLRLLSGPSCRRLRFGSRWLPALLWLFPAPSRLFPMLSFRVLPLRKAAGRSVGIRVQR